MFNSVVLEVAIGLVFTYLLLALVCTALNEWLSGVLKTRGRMLERGIAGLLKGQRFGTGDFLDAFQSHALIASLRSDPSTPPSYMAARTFALAIMDLLTKPGSITFSDLETGIKNLPDGCVKTALLAVIQNADGDLAAAQKGIENWFDDAMDRVSGWFARHKQWISVALAAGLTLFANADTFAIANKLWVNPTLRQEIVQRAATDPAPADPAKAQVNEEGTAPHAGSAALLSELGDLAGWKSEFRAEDGGKLGAAFWLNFLAHIPGWLLTTVAVSLGAPFWFDLLNRFMSLRTSGNKPQ